MTCARRVAAEFDVPAKMRDGTTLYANVFRPAEGGEYPVLLARLPYGKDGPRDTTYFDPLAAARRGYVVVIQDVRGRFASEGEFVSFAQEAEDGYDSVEWAAGLPGSNGEVGMWGLSYYGKTQLHAASMRPPSLKALAPGQTWGDHLNGASLRGGAQELGLVRNWTVAAIAPDVLFRSHAKDPEGLAQKLPELVKEIDALTRGRGAGFDALPISTLPYPGGPDPALVGLGLPAADPFWRKVNVPVEETLAPEIPGLYIGGWYDCFIGETLRQYERVRDRAQKLGGPAPRLLVGPWTHAGFGSSQGDLDFGLASAGLSLDARESLADLQLRFFDAALKDPPEAPDLRFPHPDAPPVRVFVMGENCWRDLESWPPPGASERTWHLHPGGLLSPETPPAGEDSYLYDPVDPVPTLGGQTLLPAAYGIGPLDQRPIETRRDVLVYTSEPLGERLTLLGPVRATLFAATSATDTDFVVRLTDVHPDGRSIVLADGIVRASERASYPAPGVIEPVEPSPVEPERVYRYEIDLWATAVALEAGHRLRVHVTSSSFPRWDRNPNTGPGASASGRTEVARQRIAYGPERPGGVTITLVDGRP